MSDKIPCCMGCAVYGHDRCTCVPPYRRVVEVELPLLKRLLIGTATAADRRKVDAAVRREEAS